MDESPAQPQESRALQTRENDPLEQYLDLFTSSERPLDSENENIQIVLGVLRYCQKSIPEVVEYTRRLSLSPAAYKEVLRQIEADESLWGYFNTKVRYEYDPAFDLLSIRIRDPVEDMAAEEVIEHIMYGLELTYERQGEWSKFARRVVDCGSAVVRLETEAGDPWDKTPSGQLKYQGAPLPGVILEATSSQNVQDLDKLARRYIKSSKGDIKVVVGIDLDYPDGSATVAVWRVQYDRVNFESPVTILVDQNVYDEKLREAGGKHSEDTYGLELYLTLADFASNKVLASLPGLMSQHQAFHRAKRGES